MFDATERQVFDYYDGAGSVMGDPLAIYRRLVALLDGDLDGAIKASRRQVPEGHPDDQPLPPERPSEHLARMEAQGRLVAAVREALEMRPYDRETGQGATDTHALAALGRFLGWTEKNWHRDGTTST